MGWNAGLKRIAIQDRNGTGSVQALVFYPTATPPAPINIGPYTLHVAADAAPLVTESMPLVIVSHGSGSSPLAHRTLAAFLAENGCLVCLPEHAGNHRADNALEGTFENLAARPGHVRAVIEHLESSDEFAGLFSRGKLVLVGHSLGGHTALSLAGGRPDTTMQVDFCRRPDNAGNPAYRAIAERMIAGPVPVGDSLTPAAVVLMVPGAIDFAHDEGLTELSAPVLLYTAEYDAESHEHAEVVMRGMERNGGHVTHRRVDNATHYAFVSPFPEQIRDKVGAAGMDPPGFVRADFQDEMHSEILGFIRETTTDI